MTLEVNVITFLAEAKIFLARAQYEVEAEIQTSGASVAISDIYWRNFARLCIAFPTRQSLCLCD